MRKLLMVVLVLAFACTSAFAFGPVANNMTNTLDSSVVSVITSANQTSGIWTWEYLVTPGVGSTNITMFRLNLGQTIASSVISVANPINTATLALVPDWYNFGLSSGYITWSDLNADYPIAPGSTYKFAFDTRLGPASEIFGSALGEKGYTGNVPGPAVPEPGSILALASCVAASLGFLKIKK